MNIYLVPNQQMIKKEWKAEMLVYLADSGARFKTAQKEMSENEDLSCGELSHTEMSGAIGELFRGTYLLQSFAYVDEFTEKMLLPNCKGFLLDSGAFTFFSSGKGSVNWDNYIKRYAEFINRNNIELFFELDIDSLIGYEKVLYYRGMLERLTGKPCIPVWHKSRGKAEFVKMCEQYKYVAIGGIVSREITRKEYQYFPWFIDTAHKHGAKIHGLGFTNLEGIRKYHFDSVDSSSWTTGNRFGQTYIFNGKTLECFDKKEGTKIGNHQALSLHNFTEWKKFQQYAEKYL